MCKKGLKWVVILGVVFIIIICGDDETRSYLKRKLKMN